MRFGILYVDYKTQQRNT